MEGKTLLGIMLTALYLLSLLYGGATGRAGAVGAAAMEGAQAAVEFSLRMAGGICLWSGVLELLERCGAAVGLAAWLRPLLRRLFPRSAEKEELLAALTEISLGSATPPPPRASGRQRVWRRWASGERTSCACWWC